MSLWKVNAIQESTSGSGVSVTDLRADTLREVTTGAGVIASNGVYFKAGPTFDVRAFAPAGTAVDGTVDWTTYFADAKTAAVNAGGGICSVPPGSYVLTAFPALDDNRVVWHFSGTDNCILRWNGAAGTTVFVITTQRIQLRGGVQLTPHTATQKWAYTAVTHSSAGSRCMIDDLYAIYPDNGPQLTTCYGNRYTGLHVYQYKTSGIATLSQANTNYFLACKEITGTSVASSVGISNNGMANIYEVNELSAADSNLVNTGGTCTVRGTYNENAVTYAIDVQSGVVRYEGPALANRTRVASGAVLLTNTGKNLAPGASHQPATRNPFAGLTCYYPLQDGSGTTLRDYSGNRNHGAVGASGTTWSSTGGLFGGAVQIDSTGFFTVNAAALTNGSPWTIAIPLSISVAGTSNFTRACIISDGTNTIQLQVQITTANLEVRRNGVFVGNLGVPVRGLGDIVWVLVSYDGTSTITLRHPSNLGQLGLTGQSYALANPFAGAITAITLHGSSSGTATYHEFAAWNREVTADELLDWVSRPVQSVPIANQPRDYVASLTPVSVAAASVAEQTFTVTGLAATDVILSVNPPATANNIGIVGWRVSAANTLALRFVNPTAGALTPTAGSYIVVVGRP